MNTSKTLKNRELRLLRNKKSLYRTLETTFFDSDILSAKMAIEDIDIMRKELDGIYNNGSVILINANGGITKNQ